MTEALKTSQSESKALSEEMESLKIKHSEEVSVLKKEAESASALASQLKTLTDNYNAELANSSAMNEKLQKSTYLET